MNTIRTQLTLFIEVSQEHIETVRATYNPEQYKLISAHITLCREDELKPFDEIIERLKSMYLKQPLRITLGAPERFANGTGVFLPATGPNIEFKTLRETILGTKQINEHYPHVTLMHPRNSTCTDPVFSEIKKHKFPTELYFHKISVIEQVQDGPWQVLDDYYIADRVVI
ncbi:conserved hypothetical protein, 2'-5' RNA ligase superfamily [Formosa agariphila KMM 3901]|uniref:2'-5' RNA ligase n=1 Tax=Formosa agariphila (strain DSM 15362 / KCTC 12365 / LMG 23005 / KMM 3901 / M-2Alg 35-1) TaxID=1347342 RepID=T2KMX2_FORAG|nr:2'-5' RNA ligase family protein [Formosa agariphila]CDF79309.1 conserved hypothetical protein, 2'-5' RNA ligase superfamily [Formosa agariphila KMM 3901]